MKKITLLALFLFLSAIQQINASTYYVDKNATGNGNGTSWANAFTTIESALTTAIVGDQVWVAAGVYKPTGATYNIPNGIKIYGGFAGTETTLAQRDFATNTTTLNGDIGTVGTATDNCKGVITMTNTSNLNVIDGFRIINGYNNTSSMGGGIKVSGGSGTIQNCEFLANYAFEGACIGYSGTGILNILNCKMTNNNALKGGAVHVESGGTVYIKDSVIQSNIASNYGGAVYSEFATVILDRCDVSGNSADDLGGAFYAGSTALYEIYNSLIVGNLSEDKAVLYMAPITNEKTHKIINCTISGNRNTSTSSTSSIITLSYSGGCPFYNNIMYNNTATLQLLNGVVRKCFINGTIVTDSATGVSTANPGFANIGNPAAAPFTTDGFDYHLSAGSPAINYGTNSYVNPLYNSDIEGNNRIFENNVDAGAYESQVLGVGHIAGKVIPLYYNTATAALEFDESGDFLNKELMIYDFTGKRIYSTTVASKSVTLNLPASGYYIALIEGYAPVKFYQQ